MEFLIRIRELLNRRVTRQGKWCMSAESVGDSVEKLHSADCVSYLHYEQGKTVNDAGTSRQQSSLTFYLSSSILSCILNLEADITGDERRQLQRKGGRSPEFQFH